MVLPNRHHDFSNLDAAQRRFMPVNRAGWWGGLRGLNP
jgi:hypothetical protein